MRRGVAALVAAAVVTAVVVAVVVAGGESRGTPARVQSPRQLLSSADVPTQPPLPRPHPTVVDPVAGDTAGAVGQGGFAPPDNAPPAGTAAGSAGRQSPGAPSDAEVRAELVSLRKAQRSAGLGPGTYVNPLGRASVTPERIDMGVDYAGRGPLLAIGAALITAATRSSGWPGGGWVSYRLLDGPDAGKMVYYAEGIVPAVRVNQVVRAGQPVAAIIPGSGPGIEIGWAGNALGETYARAYGGGYSEGQRTAAGQAFSDFIQSLGAPPGLAGGRGIAGRYP